MMHRRAKIIEDKDLEKVNRYIAANSKNPARDKLVVYLTAKAGLRASEVARIRWDSVIEANGKVGDILRLFGDMVKGKKKYREIAIGEELRGLLRAYRKEQTDEPLESRIIKFQARTTQVDHALVVWLGRLYVKAGLLGCTSHSGRRTFITKCARINNLHGCSLVDVQVMAGHSDLKVTQRYIEPSPGVRSMVNAI